MSNFYQYLYGRTMRGVAADDAPHGARRHPDGSPCAAKSDETCPILRARRLLDEADRLDPNLVDCENVRPLEINAHAHTYDEVRNVLNRLVAVPMKSADGIEASLSKKSISKILSGKAVAKSSSLKAHLVAAENLSALFSRAIEYFHETGDRGNVKTMHRLAVPFSLDGKNYVAKISVKEFNDGTSNRLYTIEALDIANPDGILASVNPLSREGDPHRDSLVNIVSHFFAECKGLCE